jgi:peptidyl-prolyl cis-trans isomerase A (cyclophilin A)
MIYNSSYSKRHFFVLFPGGIMKKLLLALLASIVFCHPMLSESLNNISMNLPEGLYADIITNRGNILIKLEYEKTPLTVGNFIGLAEGTLDMTNGKRFFDGLTFHRVVKDFVIQTGDPLGDGSGGAGYEFPNEISSALSFDTAGVVGMANAGPNTNSSQFFITLAEETQLDGDYTIFGHVVEGMDVVRSIVQGDKINKVEIIRNGNTANAFSADQSAWNSRVAPLLDAIQKTREQKRVNDLATIQQKWPDLVMYGDGIFQKQIKPGSGVTPRTGQTLSVAYTGMLIDGTVFDTSDNHGGTADFKVGMDQVIPGWDKVFMTMKKGEKRMIVIPPELAFGSRGTPGGPIPPDSFLFFEVELLEVK